MDHGDRVKLGVIGLGVVGGAVFHGLERIGHQVHGFDIKDPSTSIHDVIETTAVFVCVPTPQREDGTCETKHVQSVVVELEKLSYRGLIVIKSTVPPGTTAALEAAHGTLRFAFCPEFLRERAAFVDFVENHDVCVIGAHSGNDAELVREAHGSLPTHVAIMSPTEAELAKYYSNVFNALRVVFANEFFEVCKRQGADYMVIKAAMVKRTTIADAYLDCNDRFRGFGGVCLPKDTAAFAAHVRAIGLGDLRLFDTIVEENRKFRTTVPEGMRES